MGELWSIGTTNVGGSGSVRVGGHTSGGSTGNTGILGGNEMGVVGVGAGLEVVEVVVPLVTVVVVPLPLPCPFGPP